MKSFVLVKDYPPTLA